jgi:ABC-type transport system involved in multi-copper enzyme maturation permease subunit
MILEPLLIRELRRLSRRWRTYALRAAYLSLLGGVLWLTWGRSVGDVGLMTVSELADVGRDLFRGFFLCQIVFLTFAPAATAYDLLSREVRGGTMDILLLTPSSARSIVRGKWKAAMAEGATYVLCGTPILAAAVFLGGAGPWDLLWATTTSLCQAAFCAAIALRFATSKRKVPPNLGDAIATTVAWQLAPLLFTPLLTLGAVGMAAGFPLYGAVFALWDPDFLEGAGGFLWILNPVSVAIFVTVFLDQAANGGFDALREQPIRRSRWSAVHAAPVPEGRALVWKELRLREAAWGPESQRSLMVVSLLLLGALMWLPSNGRLLWPLLAFCLILAVLSIFNGAHLFRDEADRRRWDLLLSTPLRPAGIVGSKLAAAALAPESKAVAALFVGGVIAWCWPLGAAGALLVGLSLFLFLLFATLLAATTTLLLDSPLGGGWLAAAAIALILALLPWLEHLARVSQGLRPAAELAMQVLHPVRALGPVGELRLPPLPRLLAWAGPHLAAYAVLDVALAALLVHRVGRLAR